MNMFHSDRNRRCHSIKFNPAELESQQSRSKLKQNSNSAGTNHNSSHWFDDPGRPCNQNPSFPFISLSYFLFLLLLLPLLIWFSLKLSLDFNVSLSLGWLSATPVQVTHSAAFTSPNPKFPDWNKQLGTTQTNTRIIALNFSSITQTERKKERKKEKKWSKKQKKQINKWLKRR